MAKTLYQTVNNFPFPTSFESQKIQFGLNYSAKNTDKVLVTYPKCGTTWTQQIILLILNDGIPLKSDKDLMNNSYIEYSGEEFVKFKENVIKTHLPFHLMPYNKSAKYLVVFRNPKDACVSFFHHRKNRNDGVFDGEFSEYFQYWIKGEVGYGDYFSHTLSLWSHRFDDNFSFLVYEHMKYNPRDAVLKIGQFLGEEYVSKLTDNNGLFLDKVIQNSTVESMKSISFIPGEYDDYLVRKGIVGDWKSHFTKDESDLVDQKVKQLFSGTGLEDLWSQEMKW